MDQYNSDFTTLHTPLLGYCGLSVAKEDIRTNGYLDQLKSSLANGLGSVSSNDQPFVILPFDKSTSFKKNKQSHYSLMSPLTPGSDLYPDGFIDPKWIKKHKWELPCVFIDFHIMYERREGETPDLTLEKDRDLILCSEINERRKVLQERGIKYALVIMLQHNTVDKWNMEDRITFIKRTCVLDPKLLFILPPLGDQINIQVPLFIAHLLKSLQEPALAYYRDSTKRIKKKKARRPSVKPTFGTPQSSTSNLTMGSTMEQKPLPSGGWNVRNEFKQAVFAEFRQEFDVAVKHYETSYNLVFEFINAATSGPAIFNQSSEFSGFLFPFTNRWEEAKYLVDVVSIKLCKLFLCMDLPIKALQQFQKHLYNMRNVPEFAFNRLNNTQLWTHLRAVNVQYPGGGSFECWKWVSVQYQVFGEIIEQAVLKLNFQTPFPPPGAIASPSGSSSQTASLLNTLSTSGMNVISGGDVPVSTFGPLSATITNLVIQHAGYYYLTAARCAEERWKRYQEAYENTAAESPMISAPPPVAGSSMTAAGSVDSLLFSNVSPQTQYYNAVMEVEKTIDHGALVISLLTKVYEQFKSRKAARTALYVASEIARVYEISGRYEMSLKFFDRISKTYRNDRWHLILVSILKWSITCAKMLGLVDVILACLVELLDLTEAYQDRLNTFEELFAILDGKVGCESGWKKRKDGPLTIKSTSNVDNSLIPLIEDSSLPASTPSGPINVTVPMDEMNAFIKATVQFHSKETFVSSNSGIFQLTLSANSDQTPPSPLTISKIYILFNNSNYDHVLLHNDGAFSPTQQSAVFGKDGSLQLVDCSDAIQKSEVGLDGRTGNFWSKAADLEFRPGSCVVFEGRVTGFEASMVLRVQQVVLVVESQSIPGNSLKLCYKISDRKFNDGEEAFVFHERRRWLTNNKGVLEYDLLEGFGEQSSLSVTQRQPKVVVDTQYQEPAYVEQVFPVEIVVSNEESEEIVALLEVEIKRMGSEGHDTSSDIAATPDQLVFTTADPRATTNTLSSIDLGPLEAHGKCKRTVWIYVRSHPGDRMMTTNVFYKFTKSTSPLSLSSASSSQPEEFFKKTASCKLAFELPFEVTCTAVPQPRTLFNGNVDEVGLLCMGGAQYKDLVTCQEFVVTASVKCMGPWDVVINNSRLLVNDSADVVCVIPPGTEGVAQVLESNQTTNFVYRVLIKTPVQVGEEISDTDLDMRLGSLALQWKKRSKQEVLDEIIQQNLYGASVLELSTIMSPKSPIHITLDLPSQVYLKIPFTVVYNIENGTEELIELQATVEASEGFVFAGYKQLFMRVLPFSSHKYTVNMFPIQTGKLCLPKLHVVRKLEKQRDSTGRRDSNSNMKDEFSINYGASSELVVFVKPKK